MQNQVPALRAAATLCLVAALALLVMLWLALSSGGVTQQNFEAVRAPDLYAEAMRAGAGVLRVTLAFDLLFALCFTTALLFGAAGLARPETLFPAALACMGFIALGVLDWLEDIDFLTMMATLDAGGAIDAGWIAERATLSHMKWQIGASALFVMGFVIPPRGVEAWLLKLSLWFVLPVVVAGVFTLGEPWAELLSFVRYGLMLTGFALFALVFLGAAQRQSVNEALLVKLA
jgi:hypothetical protein